MWLSAIKGVIDRRILVNYRVDAKVAAPLLPAPFRPKLAHGYAMAGICLIPQTDSSSHSSDSRRSGMVPSGDIGSTTGLAGAYCLVLCRRTLQPAGSPASPTIESHGRQVAGAVPRASSGRPVR